MATRPTTPKREVLQDTSFGERVAEDEINALASYFVETDQWRQLFAGEVDVVYGPKGSGKSALYSLLVAKREELFDRNILIVPAEHPSGQTAFANVALDPPTSEHEFIGLWKVYFLGLIAGVLQEWGVQTADAKRVYRALEEAGLLQRKASLQKLLRGARDYVKTVAQAESVEGGLVLDPATGMPMGVTGRITLRQPRHDLEAAGITPIDELLAIANEALSQLDFKVWLILDRLDVAFVAREELEQNALRALFKSYLDMRGLDRISTKIFLRTDIWRRIASTGFREATHITRNLTIKWERQSLLNLVMRRALKNEALLAYYDVDPDKVLASVPEQETMLVRLLPDQVDLGRNPKAFEWMLSRVQDGTGAPAPRELIHLLSSLRESQLRRYELGHDPPPGELLVDRAAFKDALKNVSEVRLTRTLFAEYPSLKRYVEQLYGEKTQQNPETLGRIWGLSAEEARALADELEDVGLFERRGTKQEPVYWVPFLYRDALNLVQGEAK
jgi:hypothetical protein